MGKLQHHRAFTIVEVVLALGVVAFSLIAIIGVFPTGMRANRLSVTDTRAAQLAAAITATIDAQATQFSNVNCYGLTLDLASLGKTAPAQTLYVSYPSPGQPQITDTEDINTIYFVDLTFDNEPELAPGLTFDPGRLNLIQIRIRGRSTVDGHSQFFQLVRNRS